MCVDDLFTIHPFYVEDAPRRIPDCQTAKADQGNGPGHFGLRMTNLIGGTQSNCSSSRRASRSLTWSDVRPQTTQNHSCVAAFHLISRCRPSGVGHSPRTSTCFLPARPLERMSIACAQSQDLHCTLASDRPSRHGFFIHAAFCTLCATPSFVTSTMRNRALPWIMRA
jgi:hypothetical protein